MIPCARIVKDSKKSGINCIRENKPISGSFTPPEPSVVLLIIEPSFHPRGEDLAGISSRSLLRLFLSGAWVSYGPGHRDN
jgi:hypothetical protein